jgi:hypothetical protein
MGIITTKDGMRVDFEDSSTEQPMRPSRSPASGRK